MCNLFAANSKYPFGLIVGPGSVMISPQLFASLIKKTVLLISVCECYFRPVSAGEVML